MCGELDRGCEGYQAGAGSSPRVWGTLLTRILSSCFSRFIPTCVGNSSCPVAMLMSRSVHPHVCGELFTPFRQDHVTSGSSPRVWGTRVGCCGFRSKVRFIPTCVGNSALRRDLRDWISVHPHVCGELKDGSKAITGTAGSSPRVWGTQGRPFFEDAFRRFIPTCVGNSFLLRHLLEILPVHPHVCGELVDGSNVLAALNGSSPRVWGTRSKAVCFTASARFIPTCVGNSVLLSFFRTL